jgi:hypothetical protein
VYPTEKLILESAADKALVHKLCLKCRTCQLTLNVTTYVEVRVLVSIFGT